MILIFIHYIFVSKYLSYFVFLNPDWASSFKKKKKKSNLK